MKITTTTSNTSTTTKNNTTTTTTTTNNNNNNKLFTLLQVPEHLPLGNYTIRVEGNDYGSVRGSLFIHESSVDIFKPKLIFSIQLQQPLYIQTQTG